MTLFCDQGMINYFVFVIGVKYYWARSRFPDLVEEDKRVFVSYDGALYFSALEQIDQGNYSCNVLGEDKTASTGKNGPVFPLTVTPNGNSILTGMSPIESTRFIIFYPFLS